MGPLLSKINLSNKPFPFQSLSFYTYSLCLGHSISTLANSYSFFKTQLSLCLLPLTTKMGLIVPASCIQSTVYVSQSSTSDIRLQSLFFVSSSPCGGLRDIYLSSIYLFIEWMKEEHGEEKPLLLMEGPDLWPAGHHLFLPPRVWLNTLGLGSDDFSQFP